HLQDYPWLPVSERCYVASHLAVSVRNAKYRRVVAWALRAGIVLRRIYQTLLALHRSRALCGRPAPYTAKPHGGADIAGPTIGGRCARRLGKPGQQNSTQSSQRCPC